MKKRLSACVLALALLFTCLPLSALASWEGLPGFQCVYPYRDFSDIPQGAWYGITVRISTEFGVLNGVGGGRYDPAGSVTVAQAIKVAACIHSFYTTGSADFGTGSPWYQPYVDYAERNGIVNRTWPDYNRAATRMEMAEIFVAALPEEALPEKNTVVDNAIPDLPSDRAGAAQVYRLYRAGILWGSNVGHFYLPDTKVRRSELSAIVARLIVPNMREPLTMSKPYEAALTAEVTGNLTVTLSWNRVDGADGYSVCMATSSEGPWQYLPSVGDPDRTSYVRSVDKAGIYYFKVGSYRIVDGKTVGDPFFFPCVVTVPAPR